MPTPESRYECLVSARNENGSRIYELLKGPTEPLARLAALLRIAAAATLVPVREGCGSLELGRSLPPARRRTLESFAWKNSRDFAVD